MKVTFELDEGMLNEVVQTGVQALSEDEVKEIAKEALKDLFRENNYKILKDTFMESGYYGYTRMGNALRDAIANSFRDDEELEVYRRTLLENVKGEDIIKAMGSSVVKLLVNEQFKSEMESKIYESANGLMQMIEERTKKE